MGSNHHHVSTRFRTLVAQWTNKGVGQRGLSGPRPGATVLFLDFDGVMHPAESGSFCNMQSLEHVLEACPAVDVVLSTNWRINASLHYLMDIFPVHIRHRVVGVNPLIEDAHPEREVECRAYLVKSGVSCAVALDDDASLFSPACPFLFQVDRYVGLDAAASERLIARLAP